MLRIIMLCLLIVNSFLLLSNIPLWLWLHYILFIHSLPDGHLGCFPFVAITNKPPVNICVQVFVKTDAFIFPWLDYLVGVCLTFQETAEVFSKVVVTFYIPTSSMKVSFPPHPCQHLICQSS